MVMFLAVGAVAPAGEGNGKQPPSGGKKSPGYRLPSSILVSCPVIRRLKLSPEQVASIKKMQAENNSKIEAHAKEAAGDPKKRDAYYRERRKLLAALREQVAGELDEDQRRKYDAGRKVVLEYDGKVRQVLSEYLKTRREAGGDEAKVAAARKAYDEKKAPLVAEMNRLLDEKVGKLPEPKKRKKAASKPKSDSGAS
jgi:hypothetical protein